MAALRCVAAGWAKRPAVRSSVLRRGPDPQAVGTWVGQLVPTRPSVSTELVRRLATPKHAAVIDVGRAGSVLVGQQLRCTGVTAVIQVTVVTSV